MARFNQPLLLPRQPEEKLSFNDLRSLFAIADWGVVLLNPAVEGFSSPFSPESMFKAFALPFLTNIPTEHHLARALSEVESLKNLCGFSGETPTRKMLWHYRNDEDSPYIFAMQHLLIEIAIAGKRLNLTLPFIEEINLDSESGGEQFQLNDLAAIRGQIWLAQDNSWDRDYNDSWVSDDEDSSSGSYNDEKRKGVDKNLKLPFKVRICLSNIEKPYDILVKTPSWLHKANAVAFKGKDTIEYASSSTLPYSACNILVTRFKEDDTEILLARRRGESGTGKYTLPGGKCKRGETLQACALRELLEETGLRLIASKPVSIAITYPPGRPFVVSVGILATNYVGIPKNTEPALLDDWEWHSLNALPEPLFEPARIVLEHYQKHSFENLSWDDFEITSKIVTNRYAQEQLFK